MDSRSSHKKTAPKYVQVAVMVRAQVADGMLRPGEPAPSGAALARVTGYSVLTCRKALNSLLKEGVLVVGASRNARARVPAPAASGESDLAAAARALSTGLAARRRAVGLTQSQLAALAGVSVTTVGHAETGRLWQSRRFWERVDKEMSADGELLTLHDAYRVTAANAAPATVARAALGEADAGYSSASLARQAASSPVAVSAPRPVACVTITWADGSVTSAYPPDAALRPT